MLISFINPKQKDFKIRNRENIFLKVKKISNLFQSYEYQKIFQQI